MGYDIGCAFGQTLKHSSLGREFEAQNCRCCVNAFHGYSHSYDCQKQHHPNVIEGMGLEDLEILERIFSSSNQLGGLTRYMTRYRRRVFIDQFFRNWDSDKYTNLGIMLHNNYVQAIRIIDEEVPALTHAKEVLNIGEGDLEQWHIEEVDYFRNLGKEPGHDVHRAAYVDALQSYREIRYFLDFELYTLLLTRFQFYLARSTRQPRLNLFSPRRQRHPQHCTAKSFRRHGKPRHLADILPRREIRSSSISQPWSLP